MNAHPTRRSSATSSRAGSVIALGIAPLTVNEQTTMLATIADNGVYHQAHLVKYWQNPGAGTAEQTPKVARRTPCLTAQQAGHVQYAMEATTFSGGTAYPNVTYGLNSPGMVISKTGTTTGSHVGLLHRRDHAVRAGGRHVHREPLEGHDGKPGHAGRRRFRWLLAGEDLEHLRPGGVLASRRQLSRPARTSTAAAWNLLGKVPKPKTHGHLHGQRPRR